MTQTGHHRFPFSSYAAFPPLKSFQENMWQMSRGFLFHCFYSKEKKDKNNKMHRYLQQTAARPVSHATRGGPEDSKLLMSYQTEMFLFAPSSVFLCVTWPLNAKIKGLHSSNDFLFDWSKEKMQAENVFVNSQVSVWRIFRFVHLSLSLSLCHIQCTTGQRF